MGRRRETIRFVLAARSACRPGSLARSLCWPLTAAILLLLGSAVLAQSAVGTGSGSQSRAVRVKTGSNLQELPLMFEENRGQTDPRVKFLSRGPGYTLFLTEQEAVFAFSRGQRTAGGHAEHATPLRLRFENSNRNAQVAGEGKLPGTTNYFPSSDRATWHTGIRNYSGVAYGEIYPGVNAFFHGDPQRLEFDFEVAPGANPSEIALDVAGGRTLRVDGNGNIVLGLGKVGREGQIILGRPVVYQQFAGARHEVAGRFVKRGAHRIGFSIGSYDRARPLVIDPTLSYSTYLGGSGSSANSQYGIAVAVDSSGDAYVTGGTNATDFPTPTGTGGTGEELTYVTKFSPGGSSLLYTTFLPGGFSADGIAVDSNDSAYLGGYDTGAFTTTGAYAPAYGRGITIVKLSADGSQIVYAAQLGPAFPSYENSYGLGIAVDSEGSAYVAASTNELSFPTTPGTIQSACWSTGCTTEATVTKLSPDGSSLVYSTLLGGHGGDGATGIAVDSNFDAYVTGSTGSTDFPTTTGALQPACSSSSGYASEPPNCSDTDAFVSELNPTGTALIYSTFLGNGMTLSNGEDQQIGMALDAAGNVYVAGSTDSTVFTNGLSAGAGPTNLGPPVTCGSEYTICTDGITYNFLAKVAPGGGTLSYLGFLGGYSASPNGKYNGYTFGDSVAVDSSGNAYLTGVTTSNFFPVTSDALQSSFEEVYPYADNPCSSTADCGSEAYLSILNTEASGNSSLVYSTYIGSATLELNPTLGLGIAVDSDQNVWLTGQTTSSTFPTTSGALQSSCTLDSSSPSYCDDYAFVTEFATATTVPAATITPVSGSGQSAAIGSEFANPLAVKVTDASGNPVSGATVTFTGPSSGAGATLSSATATTDSNGNARVTATANGIAGGTAYQVSASVSGVSTPATFSLTNTQAATTIAVTPSTLSLVYGQPVTVNAAISPASVLTSNPTGSVAFYDGATALTPDATVASAAASYTVSVPTVGSHTYAAQYLGDSNFAGSALTGAASAVMVNKAAVTLTGPATQLVTVASGQPGSIVISVSGQFSGSGVAAPSGSITWTVSGNGFAAGTAPIGTGSATIPVPDTVVVGSYTVTVNYAGDANYNAATAITVALTITSSAQPAVVNDNESIAVSDVPSALTGDLGADNEAVSVGDSVSVQISGYPTEVITDNEAITVSDAVAQVLPGALGGDQEAVSVQDAVSVAVGPIPTSIMLSGPSNATVNQAITFTATVEHLGSSLVPTGSVTFAGAGNLPVSVALNGSGVAAWTTSALAAGSYSLVATYAGTSFFSGSSAGAGIKVAPTSTTMVLTASTTSVVVNSPVTLAAAVSEPNGPIELSGYVAFYFKGTAIFGCAAVAVSASTGLAACTTSALPAGDDSITAAYSGDPNFLPSTSPAVTVTVIDFKLQLTAPTNLDLFPGQSVSFPFVVSPANGIFSGTIGFAMNGLPPDVTATFDPSSVILGDTSQTVTVTLTAASLQALERTGQRSGTAAPLVLALLLPLMGFGPARRRLRRSGRLALLVLFSCIAMAGLGACTGSGFFNQPPQKYSVTLTATCGADQHSTTFNLTVE